MHQTAAQLRLKNHQRGQQHCPYERLIEIHDPFQPELVRQKTRETLDVMKPGGGYVAGASHDTILEETPLENVVAMFETVREHGVYG